MYVCMYIRMYVCAEGMSVISYMTLIVSGCCMYYAVGMSAVVNAAWLWRLGVVVLWYCM